MPFLVPNDYDLSRPANCVPIGELDINMFTQKPRQETHSRPRMPLPPKTTALPPDCPTGLKALYALAAQDLRLNNYDPGDFYVYLLCHSSIVPPGRALREPQWHFDLMRNLRAAAPAGHLRVSFGYAVSNILTTEYAKTLLAPDGGTLPARQTISDLSLHQELGQTAPATFRPEPGQVMRYDTLTLHRGTANSGDTHLARTFLHIGFGLTP